VQKVALPLGIGLVGFGAILLFIAFHNVPSNVKDLPALIQWMAAGFKGDTSFPGTTAPSKPSGGGGGLNIPPIVPGPGGVPIPV
jgi:hypothetical protein